MDRNDGKGHALRLEMDTAISKPCVCSYLLLAESGRPSVTRIVYVPICL